MVIKRIYLRAARERLRWSQMRLSRESGVHQNAISRLETRKPLRPAFDVIVRLAAALGIDPMALEVGPDPKSPKKTRDGRSAWGAVRRRTGDKSWEGKYADNDSRVR